jgi:hypothetical protein
VLSDNPTEVKTFIALRQGQHGNSAEKTDANARRFADANARRLANVLTGADRTSD